MSVCSDGSVTLSPAPSCHSFSSSSEENIHADLPRPTAQKPYMDLSMFNAPQLFGSPALSDMFPLSNLLWQPGFLQNFLLSQLPYFTPTQKQENVIPELGKRRSSITQTKKAKLRKIEDDTVTQSPVNGMFIKEEAEISVEENGKDDDSLDDTAAYVQVSEETRQKVQEIPNIIGDCICFLCKVRYEDVFRLAKHKCPRISHQEYKCPECEKVFSCPANLASHRRWHKPRDEVAQCSGCGETLGSKSKIRAHEKSCSASTTASVCGPNHLNTSQLLPLLQLHAV